MDHSRNRRCLFLLVLVSGFVAVAASTASAGGYFCLAMAREAGRLENEFKHLDADGDGLLELAEYRSEKSHGLPKVCKKHAFLVLDANHDGRLDVAEYQRLPWQAARVHCQLRHGPGSGEVGTQKNCQVADFVRFDRDDDLRMSLKEFSKGAGCKERAVAQVRFDRLDEDGDGQLSMVEFSKRELKTASKRPASHEENIDAQLLRYSPPLSGVAYSADSRSAIEALIRLAMASSNVRTGAKGKSPTVKAGDKEKLLDTDGDGKVSESECWQYLYQNRPQ